MTAGVFAGFSASTFAFLSQLERNNDRAWFQENKHRYESDVLEPALALIAAMTEPLSAISPHFRAVPKRTGGSLMRVYRDTRFARDKRPYKTNVGIQFRHEQGKDVHAPGYYLHIDPHQSFLGVGIWHPDSRALGMIRDAIVDSPDAWRQAIGNRKFAATFNLAGESLKRPPRGYAADHPWIEDLKRKDFIAVQEFTSNDVMGRRLVQSATTSFRTAGPLMAFLCDAVDVPY